MVNPSYQQAVTLEVIMSAAFGIQSDFQNNPDDPIMQTALRSMRPSNLQQFIQNAIMPLLPYGREFVASDIGKHYFFKDALTMSEVARKVINIRRGGEVRKVSSLMIYSVSNFQIHVCMSLQ